MVSVFRLIKRLALFAGLAAAASVARAENISFSDFSGGLNTRLSGVLLAPNETPRAQNVLFDETAAGGITRRKGFSALNSSAIGGGSSDVNAVYQLEQSDGDKYCVAFSSTNGYYSSDGCGSFTSFASTLTRNNNVNCDSYGDNLYCVNNQYNFRFDGANDIAFSGPSDLNIIRVFRNRCFAAGTDTNPSRLYWSNLGTCNTWTTSTDFVDIDAEDGDVITAIGPPLFDLLPIYKRFSTHLLQFDNATPANRKIITVSRSIGAKNHRTVASFANRQYFESVGPYGGQPGIYVLDGALIQEASDKLRGEVDSLSNLFANTGRKTLDTKSDWDGGVFDSRAMSTSRDAGFMQSSYTTMTDSLNADWILGTPTNVSTGTVAGAITLSSTTIFDAFDDGSYSSNPTWTVAGGSFDILSGRLRGTTTTAPSTQPNNRINIPSEISSGSWAWTFRFESFPSPQQQNCGFTSGTNICFDFRYIKNSDGDFYAVRVLQSGDDYNTAKLIRLIKSVGGSVTTITEYSTTMSVNTDYAFEVVRTTALVTYLYRDSVLLSSHTDTSISGISTVEITATALDVFPQGGIDVSNQFDNIEIYQYKGSGTFVSRIFDTAISTPVWGPFTVTQSSDADKTITYEVQSSTDPDDTFESLVSQTPGAAVSAAQRRYVRYVGTFASSISTESPRLDDVTMTAASTGTWRSPELFLSNAMTSWGTFQTAQTVTGAGASIAYALYITTYSGGVWPSTGPVVVTPGSTISHSTGAYVVVVGTWTVFRASETAKTDSIVINWNEGTSARSATLAVYKNRLHYCAQTQAGTFNDVCYVLDSRGAWTKWTGVNARHLNVVAQNFVAAGSTESSGGFLYKLYDTDSDNGTAINAIWESPDHAFGTIQNVKAVARIYLLGSNDATSLSLDLLADSGLRSKSYSVDLSTGADFRIVNKTVSQSLNGNTFRIRFSNNAASKPWSIHGYGLLYRDLGLMPP